jgi:hypothetical protein
LRDDEIEGDDVNSDEEKSEDTGEYSDESFISKDDAEEKWRKIKRKNEIVNMKELSRTFTNDEGYKIPPRPKKQLPKKQLRTRDD